MTIQIGVYRSDCLLENTVTVGVGLFADGSDSPSTTGRRSPKRGTLEVAENELSIALQL
ncbi:hypothetical protein [Propionivibrio sp.]|uniref:hypothetical protein n=1 Tax=Propionivibrio sp. TaxID=2212460 RepID=UPI00262713B8|nr:hypothetical protein [Propionivibrio sp.]